MIPIYFNASSHIWIFGLFVFNGLLLTWLLRYRYSSFSSLTESLEAQVLSAFFISVLVNGAVLLVLNWLSLKFSFAVWPLGVIALLLMSLTLILIFKARQFESIYFEISTVRLVLYLFTFILLFYNGGYIEQVSDAWWHMSLATKIGSQGTFIPSTGHLNGLFTRYYPPLWHGNLALANQLSGISVDVFWNSLTAWVGVFKLMGFYLFSLGISRRKSIATLSVLLFMILPGIGVAYMRVSAWPSHVAYTAWFVMFYLLASMLNELPDRRLGLFQSARQLVKASVAPMICLSALGVLVYFTHKAELLWLAIGWLAYLMAGSISRSLSGNKSFIIDRDHILLIYIYRASLVLLIGYCVYYVGRQGLVESGLSDQLLASLLPIVSLFLLLLIDLPFRNKAVPRIIFVILLGLILASINYVHFASLFIPELALNKGSNYASSATAIGYLGDELKAPGLHLQLRSGLLYSGVLSVLVALFMLIKSPTRLTIFLSGCGSLVIVFCFSPYFFHWFQGVLNYHSPWRIALLIFHPLTWAMGLVCLFGILRESAGERS